MKTTTTTTTVVTETTVTDAPMKTRLIFVIDRSGSMQSIENEARGGFNAFVDGQKKLPGEATLTLVQFDGELETIHNAAPLASIPALTKDVYFPRGMTALYDAIGVTITKYLNDASEKNVKTIFAVLTDGAENASREFSGKAVADLIKRAETEYQWEIMFLGANINVAEIATQLNVQSTKFAAFAASAAGIEGTFAAVNATTSMYRGMSKGAVCDVSLQDTYDSFVPSK